MSVIDGLKKNFKIIMDLRFPLFFFDEIVSKGESMEKEKIDKFYNDNDIDKIDDWKKDYDGNWENPPIPEGKRIVFECF